MEDNLNEIFTDCWGRLFYASIVTSSAFHTGVVGSQLNGVVNLRTVVLRAVSPDDGQIIFYTDARSSKMEDISGDPKVSWLFYDAVEKLQIRLSGQVTIHNQDDLSKQYWEKVSTKGRDSYRAIPGPSTPVDQPADGLEYLNSNEEHNKGYNNFAVVVTRVNFVEWLSLKDSGHRRAHYRLIDGSWKGQWLIP